MRDLRRGVDRDFGRHLAAVPDELTPAAELEGLDPDHGHEQNGDRTDGDDSDGDGEG